MLKYIFLEEILKLLKVAKGWLILDPAHPAFFLLDENHESKFEDFTYLLSGTPPVEPPEEPIIDLPVGPPVNSEDPENLPTDPPEEPEEPPVDPPAEPPTDPTDVEIAVWKNSLNTEDFINRSWGTTFTETADRINVSAQNRWSALNFHSHKKDINLSNLKAVTLQVNKLAPLSVISIAFTIGTNIQILVPLSNATVLMEHGDWLTLSLGRELFNANFMATNILVYHNASVATPIAYSVRDLEIIMGQEADVENPSDPNNPTNGTQFTLESALFTDGNFLKLRGTGAVWQGRGANLMDTRSCNACAYNPANVNELIRRGNELINVWGANFIRLCLESYGSAGGRVHWAALDQDPAYLADIKAAVTALTEQRNGRQPYVMVSVWYDPSLASNGMPTPNTNAILHKLVETFGDNPHVMFGVSNEPQMNYSGTENAVRWKGMLDAVEAIRKKEKELGFNEHIVAVQGLGGWARFLSYYINNPIPHTNVVYETHIYDKASDFQNLIYTPAQTLPVVIGEFGPAVDSNGTPYMSLAECTQLIEQCNQKNISWLGWAFHHKCPPNLLEATMTNCGIGMELLPTDWGKILINGLR